MAEAAVAVRATGKRRRARELALQMLFQWDLGGASPAEIYEAYRRGSCRESEEGQPASDERQAFAYAQRLFEGVLSHRPEADERIRRHAEHWRLERMAAVDRNLLRLAIFELLHETDVPHLVVVDEAVELAKSFGSEQSGRFVNGILDALLRGGELPGSRQ